MDDDVYKPEYILLLEKEIDSLYFEEAVMFLEYVETLRNQRNPVPETLHPLKSLV